MSAETSLIVPVFNRAALTKRCLDAVLATVPAGTETIVVDDGSTDETAEVLAEFAGAIRPLRLRGNAGFANACNRGADEASGDLLVFLNNDTEPNPGWLQALSDHARDHPEASAIGAKLLYPNGAVQHAGVAFGQDGYPHHLYAGLPGDHPAVNRSRPLQAVTAACALVRRDAFERVGGFDAGYENSLEDVDLCLRIGRDGGEIHYCHRAELIHLESASRGRSDRFRTSVDLYRERWRDSVRRDDLELYAADGLFSVEYPESYPLRMEVSPLLAAVDRGREEEIERLLEGYARQVGDLLLEVVRLSASMPGGAAYGEATATSGNGLPRAPSGDRARLLAHASWIEEQIRELQLEARSTGGDLVTSRRLGYRHLIERVRFAVEEGTRAGSTVLVLSRGDRSLIRFQNRIGAHFPQADDGEYLGHHPRGSEEAIEQLEALRERGAGYVVVPSTASWWLEHYRGFAEHLGRYRAVEGEGCTIYDLASGGP
jgi:GT2 family glycosyltransferase